MKKIFTLILFALLVNMGFSQKMKTIEVSVFYGSQIYFPSKILEAELGLNKDYDIALSENILKITAINQNAKTITNLTVKTENALYGFKVKYKSEPDTLYHFIKSDVAIKVFHQNTEETTGEKTAPVYFKKKKIDPLFQTIMEDHNKKIITGIIKDKFFWGLEKIYVHEDKLYFKVITENHSNINYNVDYIKFRIKDKKGYRKSSIQDDYRDIIDDYKLIEEVKSEELKKCIFVLDKFTIPTNKELYLEINEMNGSRNLEFLITKKNILKSEKI